MLVAIIIAVVAIVFLMTEYGWTDLTGNIRNSLVFESRNQKYGAYEIRQKYGNRLFLSFLGVIGFMSLAAVTPRFIHFNNDNLSDNRRGGYVPTADTLIFNNDKPEEKKPEEPKIDQPEKPKVDPPKSPDVSTFNNSTPVASNKPVENDSTKRDPNAVASNTNHTGTDTTGATSFIPNGNPNGTGTGNNNNNSGGGGEGSGTMEVSEVEVQAELPNYQNIIAKSVRIPEELYGTDFKKGKVYVSFVVDEYGNVKSAAIKKGAHALLDPEVLRAVKAMPKWKPAMFNNKPVKVRMTVPVSVILE